MTALIMKISLFTCFLTIVSAIVSEGSYVDTSATYSVYTEWTVLDYLWNDNHTRDAYIASSAFIPENNALAGINVDAEGNIYVTVPRWKTGVPATLNRVVRNETGEYVLNPWPSWEMQEVGVEGDLQNCQSMTIDSQGRMWVIEVGRINFFDADENTIVNGPAGLWMIDVATGEVLSKYEFPSEVVSYTDSFVNDLVLDQNKEIAYLTDAWGDGALIVYDHSAGISRRYSGPSTAPDPNYALVVNGVNYGTDIFTTPIDGIGISDDQQAVFYCNIQGTDLNRVPTSVLNDFTTSDEDITAAVEVLGTKEPSDGMMYRDGVLYYGSLTESTYYALPVGAHDYPSVETSSVPVWPKQVDFRWVDTFTRDLSDSSKFWFVANNLDLFMMNTMDFTAGTSNFRIISAVSTDTNSPDSDEDGDDDELTSYQVAFGLASTLFVLCLVMLITVYYKAKSPSKQSGIQEALI